MLRFRKAAEELGEYAADLNDKLKAVKPPILAIRTILHTLRNYPAYKDLDPEERVQPKMGMIIHLLEQANEAMNILEAEG